MLINGVILAINRHDTLRPLGIQFRPFTNSACDTKYHKWCGSISQLFDIMGHMIYYENIFMWVTKP